MILQVEILWEILCFLTSPKVDRYPGRSYGIARDLWELGFVQHSRL